MSEPEHRKSSQPSPVLLSRLESIRQALGARALCLARRRAFVGRTSRPLEHVAVVTAPDVDSAEARESREQLLEALLATARDRRVEANVRPPSTSLAGSSERAIMLDGQCYPKDRLPSVFFVAQFERGVDPGPERREVARAGMEALAAALAPPAWAPLARAPEGTVQELPPALVGSSEGTTRLRRHVLGLDVRSRLLLEGPPGSGRAELARWLARRWRLADRAVRPRSIEEIGPAEARRWLSEVEDAQAPPRILVATRPSRSGPHRGELSSELFWRWPQERLRLRALPERDGDLPALVAFYWQKHAPAHLGPPVLATVALDLLREHPWPGDLQELERVVRDWASTRPAPRRIRAEDVPVVPIEDTREGGIQPLAVAVAAFERELLRRALTAAEGNKSLAAKRLCLSRQGLYQKLRRHGLSGVPTGDSDALDSDPGRT